MAEEEVKLLNIKRLQRNDTGTYLCRVLNEYGLADLIHHLVVLPGKRNSIEYSFSLNLRLASERPSVLNKPSAGRGHFLSSQLPDEMIIIISCIIGVLLLAFLFFLIYHFRNQKSLRQTLLATRILATRGVSNLKSVS